MYDFFIVLGCFGLTIDNFVDCPGTENIILKCNSSLNKYNEMMDYLDTCRLFDKPLLEFNAIRHFIHNLQDRFDQIDKPLWLPKKFELYQKFVIDHRHCGLFIKLVLPQVKGEEINKPEEPVVIKSSSNVPINKLRLIKGKKP